MKQLRALVGSLQWLVAQVRVDMGFQLSVLHSESATVGTIIRANALVKEFKATFALKFRPLDLEGAGIVVVSNASLGNVAKRGDVGDKPLDRVNSHKAATACCARRRSCSRAPPASLPYWTTGATGSSACSAQRSRWSCWELRKDLTSVSTAGATGLKLGATTCLF